MILKHCSIAWVPLWCGERHRAVSGPYDKPRTTVERDQDFTSLEGPTSNRDKAALKIIDPGPMCLTVATWRQTRQRSTWIGNSTVRRRDAESETSSKRASRYAPRTNTRQRRQKQLADCIRAHDFSPASSVHSRLPRPTDHVIPVKQSST